MPMPVAQIVDEADPTGPEVIAFRALLDPWKTTVLANLSVFNPNHGFVTAFPNNPAAGADQAARVNRLAALRSYATSLFLIYAPAYALFGQAIAGGNAPQPAAHAHTPRPPKTKLPEVFLGKSPAAARHFIRQCTNYASICPFADPGQQIRWALQLLDGEAAPWRDEQLDLLDHIQVPAHLADWAPFVAEFDARWTDPHEAEKALDKIMQGKITQSTSVKRYNDMFNEALGLTTENGSNPVIARAYETGLKATVRNAAIAPLIGNPLMTFQEKQALMVRIDETLMQTRAPTTPAPRRHYIANNPVGGLPTSQATHNTPMPRGQTPVKVEAARQYTRLTPEERENLRQIGGCFRCRQHGHIASQCPRNIQVANLATLDPPAPTDPAVTSDF